MPASVRRGTPSYRLRTTRVGLFLGLYGSVFAIPLALFTLGASWLQAQWPATWWAIPLAVFGLLALAAPLVYIALVRQLERRVLREQRRYHQTLISASGGMTRIKEIQKLATLITRVVNRTVRLTNTALFLYDPHAQRYVLRAVRYPSKVGANPSLALSHPLVELLKRSRRFLGMAELEAAVRGAAEPDTVAAWMRQLGTTRIVPSFSDSRLLAFLVLGAKRSGKPFTADDSAIFSGLANQAALALENAMVFEELRTSEAYMIQSEKLASLGQLASGMAHEIHNPLTIISGEAQLYLERFKRQDPKVDQLLQSIIEECKRAADITRRILRFAKPAPPDVNPVDLKATIEESLSLAAYQVKLDRVERVINVPAQLPMVQSNQNQLQEVLLNLILNAYQAMGEAGGKLTLSAMPNGTNVVLTVEDNGPGIPEATLRKVFDPFYTTKDTGTGLGLFVTQRIVKAHGGSIDLSSTEGQGTCFTIRLPVWREPAAGTAAGSG